MNPKEKAKELFDKYCFAIKTEETDSGYFTNVIYAKECALIAINEVKWFHERLFYLTEGSLFDKYLNDVKQEIEKL